MDKKKEKTLIGPGSERKNGDQIHDKKGAQGQTEYKQNKRQRQGLGTV